MKKSYLLVAALLVVLVIVIAGGISMMDRDAPAPVSNSSSSKVSSAKSSSAAAAPAGANSGITMTYTCTVGSTETTLNSLNEVWANPDADCKAKQSPGTPNQAQKRALEEAYGYNAYSAHHYDRLARLFQLCASTKGDAPTGIFADSDAKREMLAAYTLCPLHPNKAVFEKVIAEDAATAAANMADRTAEAEEAAEKAKADAAAKKAEAEAKKVQAAADAEAARVALEAQKKAYADGTRVDEGNYLVGTDVQPGTWQTVATKVTDCYWEISDAQGDIIDNNFINTAPQFSITIPATAAGFTISGCTFQRIGD